MAGTIVGKDQYGRSITMVDNGDGTSTFSIPGLSITVKTGFPLDALIDKFNSMKPDVPDLASAISEKLQSFDSALGDFFSQQYSLETRLQILFLYVTATSEGNQKRIDYIQPFLKWLNSVLQYSSDFSNQISGISDPVKVVNLTWDFTDLQNADPLVTVMGVTQFP